MNECSVCHLDFGSVAAFDAHRVGKHEYLFREGLEMEPPREDGRRCLDPDELEAAQFVSNAFGRLSEGKSLARARAAFQDRRFTSQGPSDGP